MQPFFLFKERKYLMNIGRNIAIARKRKKMTQAALAEMINVTYQAVSSWERGESIPETWNLIELSYRLEVSIDWLVFNEKELMD